MYEKGEQILYNEVTFSYAEFLTTKGDRVYLIPVNYMTKSSKLPNSGYSTFFVESLKITIGGGKLLTSIDPSCTDSTRSCMAGSIKVL